MKKNHPIEIELIIDELAPLTRSPDWWMTDEPRKILAKHWNIKEDAEGKDAPEAK